MIYAGIGSRETPREVLDLMTNEAERIADTYVLRSGRAKGADQAFEEGCDRARGDKEIFQAEAFYKRYDGDDRWHAYDPENWDKAFDLAEFYHPNWGACGGYARRLHARNSFIVLGERLNHPVDFVVCWTEGGKLKGGTAQALRIADDYGIPILNYGHLFD